MWCQSCDFVHVGFSVLVWIEVDVSFPQFDCVWGLYVGSGSVWHTVFVLGLWQHVPEEDIRCPALSLCCIPLRQSLTEPRARLAVTTPQQSSCLCAPQRAHVAASALSHGY